MVRLITSPTSSSTLPILITSLSVGIPHIDIQYSNSVPESVSSTSDVFLVRLPVMNIDKKNNVGGSTAAILLYLASLQEKLQLYSGTSTLSFLDISESLSDEDFIAEMREKLESDAYLEKMDHWTLADVAVYARLRDIQKRNASALTENMIQYMQFVAKDKFFAEGEARFARVEQEAVVQTVSSLNTGVFWEELSKEEQLDALERLVTYYRAQVPLIKDQDREKRAAQRAKKAEQQDAPQAQDAEQEEFSRSALSDVEAYEKAATLYERSLNALKKQVQA